MRDERHAVSLRCFTFYWQSISAEPEVDPVYDNLRDILDGRTVAQPRFSDSTSPSSGSGDLDTAAADASVDETGAAAQDEVPQEETIEAAPETAAFPVVAGNAFSGTAERQGADVNRTIEDSRQLSVFGFSQNSNVLQNALGNSGIGNQPLPGLNNVSVAALRGSKMDVTNFVTSPSVDPLSNASLTAESPSNGFLTGQTLRSMFVGSAVIQKKPNLCVVQLTGNFQRSGTCVSSVALVNMCDGMGIKRSPMCSPSALCCFGV